MKDNKLNVLLKIFEDTLEIEDDQKRLDLNDELKNLGLNSILFIKLIVKIEEKFCIEIEDEMLDVNKFNTVRDIYGLIVDRIA